MGFHAVDQERAAEFQAKAVPQMGPAGSLCLMHARLAHASSENRSTRPRTLFIAAMAAAVPPLLPPAIIALSYGLRTAPNIALLLVKGCLLL